jgi:aspartyl-tRNA(Asn)/glutamyl-tRNA(Gln) amidotransferase subunit B
MEQGSLRVDANISLRPVGQECLGVRAEIKNVNSFANVERALEAERSRQQGILEAGGTVEPLSLSFNADTGQVHPMRSKEASRDYRYFPDPDLPPLLLEEMWLADIRGELPELPGPKRDQADGRVRPLGL